MSLSLIALALLQAAQIGAGGNVGVGNSNVVGGAVTGTVNFETVDRDFDQAPVWIREMAPLQVGSVFPRRARETGRDGSATLDCVLTVDGALRNCQVERETPEGMGFGAAAITLTPDMNIRPATKAGQPVDTRIRVRANFDGPGRPTGSLIAGTSTEGLQRIVVNPPWTAAPSWADMVAAYPAQARAQNLGGRVSLYCTFAADGSLMDACLVENEQPVGLGLADSAKALARRFRANPTVNGDAIGGRGVKIPFTFSTRMLNASAPVGGGAFVVGLPSNAEFAAAEPPAARRGSFEKAEVTLNCMVGPTGAPAGCRVAREAPVGYGYAAGAMRLAPSFRLSLWSTDGMPTIGTPVSIPVAYDYSVRPQAAR